MGVTLSGDGCFRIAPALPELCSSGQVTGHSLILLGFAFAIGSCLVVPAVLGPGLLFPLDRGKTCQCPAQGLCSRVCPVQLCQLWTLCSVIFGADSLPGLGCFLRTCTHLSSADAQGVPEPGWPWARKGPLTGCACKALASLFGF